MHPKYFLPSYNYERDRGIKKILCNSIYFPFDSIMCDLTLMWESETAQNTHWNNLCDSISKCPKETNEVLPKVTDNSRCRISKGAFSEEIC